MQETKSRNDRRRAVAAAKKQWLEEWLNRQQAVAAAKKKAEEEVLNRLAELSKKATIKAEKTEKQEVAAAKSPKKTEQQDAVKSKNALAAKKEATVKDCGHWVALKRAALDRVRRRLRPKPGDDLVLSDTDFEELFLEQIGARQAKCTANRRSANQHTANRRTAGVAAPVDRGQAQGKSAHGASKSGR